MAEYTVANYEDSLETRRALFDFYRVAYPGMDELLDDARFEWQSFQNPLAPAGRNFLFHLYDQDRRMVGQNILIPYQLTIDGRVRDALCSTNLLVLPGMEGKGLGHRLIERHEQEGQVCFAVGITPASSRAFQKRGWKPVDDARLHALFRRPGPCLRYTKTRGLVVLVASPVVRFVNVLLRLIAPMRVPSQIPGVSHETIERFDSAWDPIWAEALRPYAIHFVRRADFLNWKYRSRRDVQHQILLFRQAQEPVAYIVYRLSRNPARGIFLGRIVDLVYRAGVHPKFAHYMIGVARRAIVAAGVDGMVGIASSPELRRAYQANGFVISRVQPAIIREDGFSLAELRRKFPDIWYITLGDSDLDNYW